MNKENEAKSQECYSRIKIHTHLLISREIGEINDLFNELKQKQIQDVLSHMWKLEGKFT